MHTPTASVVIPAHNEEAVIQRCLSALLDGLEPGAAEIIVACNGCRDRTAELARAMGPEIIVLETEVASKSAALNLGDDRASAFPRVYLDADVVLRGSALAEIVRALADADGPLAAGAAMHVELGDRPWTVQAYYRVWTALPYVTEDLIGSGVYALSQAGRARFDRFPAIIADDLFVHRLFAPGERRTIKSATFTVYPPATLGALLHVHGRRRAGNLEYEQTAGAAADQRSGESTSHALLALARDPRWWPSLAVYASIVVAGKARGRWKARFGDLKVWEREVTSRTEQPQEVER